MLPKGKSCIHISNELVTQSGFHQPYSSPGLNNQTPLTETILSLTHPGIDFTKCLADHAFVPNEYLLVTQTGIHPGLSFFIDLPRG